MGFAKPEGKYADRMINPDGWPAIDEQAFLSRSQELIGVLQKVDRGMESWLQEKTEISSGGIWTGSGATAGKGAIESRIREMTSQQSALVREIGWLNRQFGLILTTKVSIFDRVVETEAEISSLESASLKPEVRQNRIDELIKAAYESNVAEVQTAASESRFSNFEMTEDQIARGLEHLLRVPTEGASPQPTAGSPTSRSNLVSAVNPEAGMSPPAPQSGDIQMATGPEASTAEPPEAPAAPPQPQSTQAQAGTGSEAETPSPSPAPGVPAAPPPAPQDGHSQSGNYAPAPVPPGRPNGTPVAPPSAGTGIPSSGQPATPVSTGGVKGGTPGTPSIGGAQGPSGGTGGGGPQAPAATAGPGQGSGAAPVNTPQQDFQKGFTDATKAANANPMPLNQTPLSSAAPPPQPAAPVYQPADTSSSTSPAATTSHSAPATSAPAPAAPPPPSAPTGPPPMPLGNPSTPSPAAPVPPSAGPVGPAVAPASTNQGAAGAAPVPISAARAERDAIAAAATAGAMRRKGPNPRQLARHIGAALNVDITDPSLFWITAVTSDGQILAANNYGLAYIPEHVHLPEQVRMVTADESIPAQIRGTWATYPLLAVQEWARHHNATLQAVAGTEENLKGFDLGAARDIITPEDMPDSGKMQGRNRLEVIAPEVATKLAGISASGLTELLPPAPADNTPPADNRINLLLEVCKPLLSANPDRAGAHLKAMVAYADHLQDVALFRAHNAQDAELQRAAIAEWIYWQHISVLSADALAAMVS